MYKKILVSLTVSLLLGCVTTPVVNELNAKENILLQTGDYQKLVPFYKNQLIENPNSDTRLKLAQAYLDSGDPESALFTSDSLLASSKNNVQLYTIQANSYYELGDIDNALLQANMANTLKDNNPAIENLLGLIAVKSERYSDARRYFNLARAHFYDDIKIKNNLAVLDIIEGHYENAVQLLLPIYLTNNKDAQLKANLLLAMAKSGDVSSVQSLLANDYPESEIQEIYYALKNIPMVDTQYPTTTLDDNKALPSKANNDPALNEIAQQDETLL